MKVEDYEIIKQELKTKRIPREIKKIVEIMLEKNGERIVVLKLKGISGITDYIIVCSGNSSRQNLAISDEIEKKAGKELKLKAFNIEGKENANWILLDYIDFIVHIFSAGKRDLFAIEKLWMDAKRYDFYPG